MDIAREWAKIILMTDRHALWPKADVVVLAQVEGTGIYQLLCGSSCLSEVFLLAISGQRDVTSTERFSRIDAVMEKEKLY